MKNPLKPGFAALRIRRLSALHARAHAAVHARDDHDLNWLCGREKTHRNQIGALALEDAAMRERVAALEEAADVGRAERLDYDRLQAAKRAALEERVAALEAEVARLTTHHPAPASDLSGLAAWSSR